MKQLKIECPNCHRAYEVAESFLGRKVICANKSCGTKFAAVASLPSQKNDAETFAAFGEPSKPDDGNPPPLPINPEPSRAPRPKAQPTRSKASESKVYQRRMTFLTVLAAVPSALLCMGGLLYWYDISNRRSTETTQNDRSSRVEVDTAPPESQAATEAPVVATLDGDAPFREQVVKTLNSAYSSVRMVHTHLEINIARTCYKDLTEHRSLIPDRKHVPLGIQVEHQLDKMMNDFRQAMQLIQTPKIVESFADKREAKDYLMSIDDAPAFASAVKESLSKVTQSANEIAKLLGIGFDEAHGSEQFHKRSLDFLVAARECVTDLKQLPPDPNPESVKHATMASVRLGVQLGFIPDAPEFMVGREAIESGFAAIHDFIVKSVSYYDFTNKAHNLITQEEYKALQKLYSDTLQTAVKVADEAERRLKKK